jgi:hypothetical protein
MAHPGIGKASTTNQNQKTNYTPKGGRGKIVVQASCLLGGWEGSIVDLPATKQKQASNHSSKGGRGRIVVQASCLLGGWEGSIVNLPATKRKQASTNNPKGDRGSRQLHPTPGRAVE